MSLNWARVYTTNYDQLVEKACGRISKPLQVVRTNLDFQRLDSGKLELLKIHGCITRDRAHGHKDSMILTERDYADYNSYREALFAKLQFDLHTKNLLIIGQSLKDSHLRGLVDQVAKLAKDQGTSNSIRILVYSSDAGRMRLLQERGLKVASGTIAQLVDAHLTSRPRRNELPGRTAGKTLPTILLGRTVDLPAELGRASNAARMFAGGAATYADIDRGLTFPRSFEVEAVDYLHIAKVQFVTITGAAGVGKTTAARRVMSQLHAVGHPVYEHVDEFPLSWEQWGDVARGLQRAGKRAFLLVDDAFRHLTGINRLANQLADEKLDSLGVVLTAHSAAWSQRSKSGVLTRLGTETKLQRLDEGEIDSLVQLIRSNDDIRSLLDPVSQNMTRDQQIQLVKNKSAADMFVALKYLFATSGLDQIVLAEFAGLEDDVQEIYKVAALLEATYASAPRQVVLEVLDLAWSDIATILNRTKGVLHQKEVNRRDGLYVWRTRHPVIAQVISRFKYSDDAELYFILRKVIDALNSSMLLDRQIVPNLCDSEWGIGRIRDLDRQVRLLEMLCEKSMNRVPWHRLIGLWLGADLTMAESTIRRALAAVGYDSPIARYEVRLKLAKAQELKALGTNDYITLILEAEDAAKQAIEKWPESKYCYRSLADVGEALHAATGSSRILEESIEAINVAYDQILDDQLLRWRQHAEGLIRSSVVSGRDR